MISKLLTDLQKAVTDSNTLTDADRAEFLKHVEAMKASTTAAPDTADTPAGNSGVHPVDDLVKSVEGFEASHPDITALVNRIAMTLSNMGL